jgi:hypothetical protein
MQLFLMLLHFSVWEEYLSSNEVGLAHFGCCLGRLWSIAHCIWDSKVLI